MSEKEGKESEGCRERVREEGRREREGESG